MIQLYVFLGNHGKEYARTRHNVAWLLLEQLDVNRQLHWKRGYKGLWSQQETDQGRIWFLKPETYMNLSGTSVAELAKFHKIPPEDILAVHDELELPFGYFGFKTGGGLGGHNGLRSMRDSLGTADYQRLRLGIGRPDHADVAGYVLSAFNREEQTALECSVFPAANRAFNECLMEGFKTVLERYKKVSALS